MGPEQQTQTQQTQQAGQTPESIALCTDGDLKHQQNAHVYEPEAAAVAAAVNTGNPTIAASFAMSGSFLRQMTATRPADRERQQKKLSDAKQPAAGVVVKQS